MKTISKWYNYEEVFYDGHRYDYDDNRICKLQCILTMKWVKQLVALPPMSQVSLCSAIP